MSRTARTGVLGGTFDPIHLGHHDVAVAARDALGLDRVLLVPARVPPHRDRGPVASAADRLAMTRLAAAVDPGLEVSDIEIRSSGPSYTAATLDRLVAAPHDRWQIFFITGADAFAEIASWHDYPHVLDRSHFAVVSRPGHPVWTLKRQLPALADRMRRPEPDARCASSGSTGIWLVDATTRDISSSAIRARLAAGHPIDELVTPAVAAYIERHHLYRAPDPGPHPA